MGISSFGTNITFHLGDNYITGAVKMLGNAYHDMEHLAQCIADLNLIRKWDLNIVDVTEYITTNGPSGPGKVLKPGLAIASRDMVAADAYTVSAFEWYGRKMKPANVKHIRLAHEREFGRMDVENLVVKRVTAG